MQEEKLEEQEQKNEEQNHVEGLTGAEEFGSENKTGAQAKEQKS